MHHIPIPPMQPERTSDSARARRFNLIDPTEVRYFRPGDQVLVDVDYSKKRPMTSQPAQRLRDLEEEKRELMEKLRQLQQSQISLRRQLNTAEQQRQHRENAESPAVPVLSKPAAPQTLAPTIDTANTYGNDGAVKTIDTNMKIGRQNTMHAAPIENLDQSKTNLLQTAQAEFSRVVPRVLPWFHRDIKSMRHPETYAILRRALDDTYEEDNEWSNLAPKRKWAVLRQMFELYSSTEAALQSRQKLLDDLDLLKEVQKWWDNCTKTNGGLDKKGYFYVNQRIIDLLVVRPLQMAREQQHLLAVDSVNNIDHIDAFESVEFDWQVDSVHGFVSFDAFHASMIELADNFTPSKLDPEEMASFLAELFNHVYRPQDYYLSLSDLYARMNILPKRKLDTTQLQHGKNNTLSKRKKKQMTLQRQNSAPSATLAHHLSASSARPISSSNPAAQTRRNAFDDTLLEHEYRHSSAPATTQIGTLATMPNGQVSAAEQQQDVVPSDGNEAVPPNRALMRGLSSYSISRYWSGLAKGTVNSKLAAAGKMLQSAEQQQILTDKIVIDLLNTKRMKISEEEQHTQKEQPQLSNSVAQKLQSFKRKTLAKPAREGSVSNSTTVPPLQITKDLFFSSTSFSARPVSSDNQFDLSEEDEEDIVVHRQDIASARSQRRGNAIRALRDSHTYR